MVDRGFGRPSKFTPETREIILAAAADGNGPKVCIALAGVSDSTFFQWLDRGREERDRGEVTDYSEFVTAYERAKGEAAAAHMSTIRTAAKTGDPKVSMWWLDRFGWVPASQRAVELTGKGGGPVQTQEVKVVLTTEAEAAIFDDEAGE